MTAAAVVTGAGGSIGRQIAQDLAASSRPVAVLDLDAGAADATVEAIRRSGGTAAAFAVDICDGLAVDAVRDEVLAHLGAVSCLVNCAGWDAPARFDETTEGTWRQVIDVNYLGMLIVTRAFLDSIKGSPGPLAIVNIASDAGRVGSSNEAVYSGAKAAVIGFSKAIARELARFGITVNCVAPGPTESPMLDALQPEVRNSMVRSIPLRRVGTPADISGAVAYFVSPNASYVTGQVLSVSGGLTMVG